MEETKEIIENIEPTTIRFSDASWFKAGPQVLVVGGAGTISSWLCMSLARIGHEVHVVDFDIAEIHNLAGQMYGNEHVGMKKVDALNDIVTKLSANSLIPHDDKISEDCGYASPIMFSGFDNMKARKAMYEIWKSQEDRQILIEGRLTAECGQVYIIQKGQEELYEKYLFDDDEVEELPCSFKSTTHCGMFIASLMTGVFNNFISNEFKGVDIREVPFRMEFDLTTLTVESHVS